MKYEELKAHAEKKRKDPKHQAKKKKAAKEGNFSQLIDLHLEEIPTIPEKIIFLIGAYTVHMFMSIVEVGIMAVGGMYENPQGKK